MGVIVIVTGLAIWMLFDTMNDPLFLPVLLPFVLFFVVSLMLSECSSGTGNDRVAGELAVAALNTSGKLKLSS